MCVCVFGVKRQPTACRCYLHNLLQTNLYIKWPQAAQSHTHSLKMNVWMACDEPVCSRCGDHTRSTILSKCGYADETIEWDNKNDRNGSRTTEKLNLIKSSFTCERARARPLIIGGSEAQCHVPSSQHCFAHSAMYSMQYSNRVKNEMIVANAKRQ